MTYTSTYANCSATSSSLKQRTQVSLIAKILGHSSNLIALLDIWSQRRQFRTDLQRLAEAGPYLLEDIGLDRSAGEIEAGKPFWQA